MHLKLDGAQWLGEARVQFIPADMNHRIARERALRRKEPAPADFRGSAAAAFEALKK